MIPPHPRPLSGRERGGRRRDASVSAEKVAGTNAARVSGTESMFTHRCFEAHLAVKLQAQLLHIA
jgi:hypothetical protein